MYSTSFRFIYLCGHDVDEIISHRCEGQKLAQWQDELKNDDVDDDVDVDDYDDDDVDVVIMMSRGNTNTRDGWEERK